MKILWVNNIFLHPTNKGGQIRTLEMLRQLHARHEIHYLAFETPGEPEGKRRSSEYATKSYAIPSPIVPKLSPRFLLQIAQSLLEEVPILVSRKRSNAVRKLVENLLSQHCFDSLVCDFLTPSINLPRLADWVLFQHNVETMIWRRYAETATDPLRRSYFQLQAERLFRYEREVCRSVQHVVAVSGNDAALMRSLFGATRVSAIPTGVDLNYFARPTDAPEQAGLVFVGSMDWNPNIDGMQWFFDKILPLIRKSKPDCPVTVAGRTPSPDFLALAARQANVTVTGTVPDVRPFLWAAQVSIVPLRIGGGTRLKIYESMAAGVATVSTTIGAEGLVVTDRDNIAIADTPEAFAARCVELLDSPSERERLARAGLALVAERFSWVQVTGQFEAILEKHRLRSPFIEPAR